MDVNQLLAREDWDRESLIRLLSEDGTVAEEAIRKRAYEIKAREVGKKVYFRGIVEFSNQCAKNCNYCGIRRGNAGVHRYCMSLPEILSSIEWAYRNRYGSVVLQSGERTDRGFVDLVTRVLEGTRELSQGEMRVTLSVGEQSPETYRRWYEAGARRFLLRIETSNPILYRQLHPADHSFEQRVACLEALREVGYQVGTGVMIGLPGQTLDNLADDLLFFKKMDIDMIGMGPYVVHSDTPTGELASNTGADRHRRLRWALRMISATRIFLRDVNIASTTALQALHPAGREMGLLAGANVIMPIITAGDYRKDYLLYDGKPCLEDSADDCKGCLERRIQGIGETIAYAEVGDSAHFRRRQTSGQESV